MHPSKAWEALRPSLPLGPPTAAVGFAFGLLGAPLLGVPACIGMSALVWSGTAQFAALSAVTAGAGLAVSAGTGLLANSRYLPMGFAIAPDTRGSLARRAGISAALADASFAIAHRRDGRFDTTALVSAAPIQYLSWVAGTALGASGAGLISNPNSFGLDALFPVFYLSLVLPDLKDTPRARVVAAVSVLITLASTPFLPAGVPVVLAILSALIGLRMGANE